LEQVLLDLGPAHGRAPVQVGRLYWMGSYFESHDSRLQHGWQLIGAEEYSWDGYHLYEQVRVLAVIEPILIPGQAGEPWKADVQWVDGRFQHRTVTPIRPGRFVPVNGLP
jgi:hypothetical protein